jgi:hypothetical protein
MFEKPHPLVSLATTVFCLLMLAKSFLTMAVATPGGLGVSSSRNVTLASKAEIIRKYGLQGEELAALELCQKLLPNDGRAPGDAGVYCGCLSKHATDEFFPGHKATAIRLALEIRKRGGMSANGVNDILSDDAVKGTRMSTARAVYGSMEFCSEQAINEATRLRATVKSPAK